VSTTVVYNGVVLAGVQTLLFDQEIVYDESDTDMIYSRFIIRVETLVQQVGTNYTASPAEHRAYPVGGNTPTAVSSMEKLHEQLSHPRGVFTYSVGGNVLVQANDIALSPFRDVNNGPSPKSVNITHVANSQLFRVEFEIEVCTVKCGEVDFGNDDGIGVLPHANVLNNRWSLRDTMDGNFYWTRSWEGELRVAHRSVNPQAVRYLVVPPLVNGYKREAFSFTTPKNSLLLRYTITDKQRAAAPPPPATDWDATYIEAASLGGAKGHAEISVSMIGPPGNDVKRALLTRAVQVAEARLGDLKRVFRKNAEGVYLTSAAIIEHLAVNRVDVKMQVLHQRKDMAKYYGFLLGTIGTTLDKKQKDGPGKPVPNYNPNKFLNPLLYDSTSPLSVFANYVQSPCSPIHGIAGIAPLVPEEVDKGEEDSKPEEPIYETPSELPDQGSDELVKDDDGNIYTYAAVDSTYVVETGRLQVPVGDTDANNPSAYHPRIHQPTAVRILDVEVERVGAAPQLPNPLDKVTDANGIDGYLIRYNMTQQAPDVGVDSKVLIFRATVRLEYGLERAPRPDELFEMGAVPHLTLDAIDNLFNGNEDFISGKYQSETGGIQ